MPDFEYTPDLVEVVLVEGQSHYLDQVELLADVQRAFSWFRSEYPTASEIVQYSVNGYSFDEIAAHKRCTPERVEEILRKAYVIMARWLNGE